MTGESPETDSLITGLTTVARSRKGRSLVAMAWPYLLAICTAVIGWAGGKMDSKAELQAAIELRREDAAKETRAIERHERVMASLEALKGELFSASQKDPGRLVKLERDQYWAWRALVESKTLALAGEGAAAKSKKRAVADRFMHSFDLRAQKDAPAVVFDELFAQVAVP